MSTANNPTNNILSFDDLKELFHKVAQENRERFKETREDFKEIREMFKETDRKFQETDMKFQETREQMKEADKKTQEAFQKTDAQIEKTNKQISALGDRIGEIIESMVEGSILKKFQKLNFSFNRCGRNIEFYNQKKELAGEIDLLLENSHIALLVEVKTNLQESDINDHIKRLNNYSKYLKAENKNCTCYAAVAGGVVTKSVRQYALNSGLFLIDHSGDSFKIIKPPKNIKLRTW